MKLHCVEVRGQRVERSKKWQRLDTAGTRPFKPKLLLVLFLKKKNFFFHHEQHPCWVQLTLAVSIDILNY